MSPCDKYTGVSWHTLQHHDCNRPKPNSKINKKQVTFIHASSARKLTNLLVPCGHIRTKNIKRKKKLVMIKFKRGILI